MLVLHLEIARDHIHQNTTEKVIGGVISPVHDAYGKYGLELASHRTNMVQIGLQSSNWICLSEWESKQKGWSTTRQVLEYHHNMIDSCLKSKRNNTSYPMCIPWLTESVQKTDCVQLKFLCGADLLESFSIPGLWQEEDVI